MRHLRSRPQRAEAGETLIEALVTIAILGIAVAALLGAILLGIKTSVQHRQQAQVQAELRSWAEQVSASRYADCASETAFGGPGELPDGLSGDVAAVQYWNGSEFAAACGSDSGLQKVTLQITVADGIAAGFSRQLHVVVRRP